MHPRKPIHAVILLLGAALATGLAACREGAPREAGHRRVAFLAGGSGEEDKGDAENFFVQDLRGLSESLGARGWKVASAVRPTRESLLKGAREALRQAGSGDQALIVIHSHGQEREERWGQRSHSISGEDRDEAGRDPGIDLDELEPSLLEARGRGVAVALVDLSCYSGATQALRGPACTVTLASRRYVSLCSGRPEERKFNSYFLKLPPKGEPADMESQFLLARRWDLGSINLPRISSRPVPAEEAWGAFLSEVDPLDIFEDLQELRPGAKPFEAARLMSALKEATRGNAEAPPLLAEIRSRLERVLATRARLERMMGAVERAEREPRLKLKLAGRDPLELGPAQLAELLDASAPGAAAARGRTRAQLNLAAALQPERDAVEWRHRAALSAYRARIDEYEALRDDLARDAEALFEQERALHDATPSVTRGCGDFKL